MIARHHAVLALVSVGMLGLRTAVAADVDGDGVPDGMDVCCNTQPGSIVDAEGRPYGDVDGDCDVDLADFAVITINFTGPSSCTPEVCDGIDNDCNCVVDDMGVIYCGIGACQNSVEVCTYGVLQTCTPFAPSTEVCNGIDDDCNGIIDDNFNLLTDVNNCGACGVVCPGLPNASPACQSGSCVFVCDPDYGDCNVNSVDGCEVYVPSDPNNCGGCGLVCPPAANATQYCSAGQCGITCLPSYADCDVNPANGCEANLANNAQHCGSCNAVCAPLPNATPYCASFTCSFSCDPGYLDCNATSADGCEVYVQSDPQNCGGCGMVCPPRPNATSICTSGNCQLNCNVGYLDCNGSYADGCEVNIATDVNNCGGCGNVCAMGAVCSGGTCVIP